MKRLVLALLASIATLSIQAQNPFLPLWEHIPDGEPYVFEDPDRPGEYRVYLYGSHDNLVTEYCGRDQVVWSAPVDDLNNWRFDGICFKSVYGADGKALAPNNLPDVLYAPDIVEVVENGKKMYYFFPNNQAGGRQTMIAKSARPDGPFEVCNWKAGSPRETYGIFGFDPAVFCDDDGRLYGYWGFEHSFAAELDPATMCTPKPGTEIIENMISGRYDDGIFSFFEASSMRKIEDKYVFIYSRFTKDGEFGLGISNYTLAYCYSDNPLGPWTYGGTIIDGRARGLDEHGNVIPTATSGGNTHGSICKIKDQWYVFYHRQLGTNEYARQAMVAPIKVKVQKGKGGKVEISEGEYTSEGFQLDGLNPFDRQPAGIACYYTGPRPMRAQYPNFYFTGSYPSVTYFDDKSYDSWNSPKTVHCPVINNTSGSIVGYKYYNLSRLKGRNDVSLALGLRPLGVAGTIKVMLDSPWESQGGKQIGTISLSPSAPQEPTELLIPLQNLKGQKGKHALFLLFSSPEADKSVCDLHWLMFK